MAFCESRLFAFKNISLLLDKNRWGLRNQRGDYLQEGDGLIACSTCEVNEAYNSFLSGFHIDQV
jgi:hypothetical protein